MQLHMPENPYRVALDNEVIFAHGLSGIGDRGPDLVVSLGPARSGDENPILFRGNEGPGAVPSPNPALRFWSMRALGILDFFNTEPIERSKSIGRDDPTEKILHSRMFRLEVFHPDKSLRSAIMSWQSANIGGSAGMLLLVVLAFVALYRLYVRTDRLRAREQDFVTSMSHELRTPISVIQASSDNLSQGVVSDPARIARYGSLINRQAGRLGRMVESILLYSGIENRNAEQLQSTDIDIKSLIEEICESLSDIATEVKVKIQTRTDRAPTEFQGDPLAIRLVIENLLMNALKHGLPSEVETAESRSLMGEIRVEARVSAPAELVITVEDEGPGILPKEARRIFEPFIRGEISVREQHPGSGLGLHLVKRIVSLLSGSISVESPYETIYGEKKSGARFIVRLPMDSINAQKRRGENHG